MNFFFSVCGEATSQEMQWYCSSRDEEALKVDPIRQGSLMFTEANNLNEEVII